MFCVVCQKVTPEHFSTVEHKKMANYKSLESCDEDCRNCEKSQACQFSKNGEVK
jgi:hypothetical protein